MYGIASTVLYLERPVLINVMIGILSCFVSYAGYREYSGGVASL
jgi:hypothetical protein